MVFKSVVQNNNFRLGYTELKFLLPITFNYQRRRMFTEKE